MTGIFTLIPEDYVPQSLYSITHTFHPMHTPLYGCVVRELCFKVKCFSYMEVYREQSSSRFITSRRQSSFCRAPWQHGIALFPPAFVGGVSCRKRQSALLSQAPGQFKVRWIIWFNMSKVTNQNKKRGHILKSTPETPFENLWCICSNNSVSNKNCD